VEGTLPLDLEIRKEVLNRKNKLGLIPTAEYEAKIQSLFDEWQERYDSTDKGEWTKNMIPNLRYRYDIPMELDHYTTQFLTGHGDFNGQLHRFKLVQSPNCSCGNGSETVRHVLLACRRNEIQRELLRKLVMEEGGTWPPSDFLKTKRFYSALRLFSKNSLTNRSDR